MIICCGEALVDMIAVGIDDDQKTFVPHSGGAIFNTAITLGRLGADVGLVSGVSEDMFGEQLVRDLDTSKVDTSYLVRSDRPTTLAFVELKDGQASYSFFDENSAGRMVQLEDFPSIREPVSAYYFGGISLASEPSGESYAALAAKMADSSVIMLDPNIRTTFISDEAKYRARLEKLFSVCDIVKISDEDLSWIYPDATSLNSAANMILNAGASLVVLTKGEDGSTGFYGDGKSVDISIEKVKVADTVGAGDSFNGGLLAKLSELDLLSKSALKNLNVDQLKQAMAFASKVAAITVSRSGANPPWASEL
ncbi:MAG: carbohydrate kinase [Lentilitoribacter sp.]